MSLQSAAANVFEDMQPTKTALVVVDMQNAFMLPGVAHALCPMAEKIVPNINRLAAAMRATGGRWSGSRRRSGKMRCRIGRPISRWSARSRGGSELPRSPPTARGMSSGRCLTWSPRHLIVEKNRFSAFIQGSSNLADVLRSRGIDTVLITGTVTNVCCESTARDAMMLNFKTIMVSDGNAAVTDEDHKASLCAFYFTFGDVMTTDAVIASLERNARKRPDRGGIVSRG